MTRSDKYFCSESIKHDLKGKTVRGGVATAVAQMGGMAIQLVSIPVLARLLSKEDFGLVAMVTVFTGFAAMFVDAGMSMATVQREKITPGQVSNLFWLSSALGGGMMMLTFALAPSIAWFYGDPRVAPIAAAMGVGFLFAGMTTQHKALLTRTMDFRSVAVVTLLAAFLSQVVAVFIAWKYQSYWALALRQVALGLFMLLGMWGACRWLPSLPRRGAGVRTMVGFGANLTGFNMINYFSRNADNLLIGKFWGEGQLGAYDVAYRLFLMPMRKINGPIGAVAVPSLSRLVDQPERYRRFYLGMVQKLCLATMPVATFLCLDADLVIPAMFADGWSESIPILRVLSIAGVLQVLGSTSGWLYISQGRSKEMMTWAMCYVPLVILAFLSGLPWGALGVACGYTALSCTVGFPAQMAWVCRKGPVRVKDFLSIMPLPLAASASVAVGALLPRLFSAWVPAEAEFAVSVATALLAMVVFVYATPHGRQSLSEARGLIRMLRQGA